MPLDAEVELLRETRRLAFFAGKVVQEDELVAAFTGALRKSIAGGMTALADRYRALVAAGELKPDADQAARGWRARRGSPRKLEAIPRKGSLFWRLAGRREPPPRRRLSVGRGRARQIDADGPRLRDDRLSAQAPRPFPRIHARGARAAARRAGEGGGRSDPAGRRGDRRRGAAALLRRDGDQQQRRRDDPVAAVRAAARRGRDRDHHLEPAAARSLQGRAQPRALPALHRPDRARAGGACR